MKKFIPRIITFLLLVLVLPVQNVFAGNSTISVDPSSGSITQPFIVKVIIDGHGDKFNAAQANVALSSNLKIQDLILGDCNFSFLHTPSAEDPSFAGIIIQNYSTKCTVYSMTLIPTAKGNGTITFSKEQIKRYGDAKEIFSQATNGSYTLGAAINPSSLISAKNNTVSSAGLYSLNLGVYKSNKPVSNATVTLNTVSSKNKQQVTTDNTGTAHYVNLKEGVYDAIVTQDFTKVDETIVNVTGPNHILTLAINIDTQKTNPLMKTGSMFNAVTTNPLIFMVILIVGIIIGVGIALLAIKLLMNRRKKL